MSSSMAPLASFMAHCSGFTDPSPAAAAMAPAGEAVAAEGRGGHVPPWCESILGLKVEAVQGKQVSLEWTEASGELWEWYPDAASMTMGENIFV